jgi:2-C-methyl-D-erythritol 4-phosphate cytidylyltransferase
MSTTAILLCAGKGERLAAGVDKAVVPLAGRPLFAWSLDTLNGCAAIDAIVMVGSTKILKDLVAASGVASGKIVAWSEGGKERQHSVGRGLHVLPEGCTHVAIHDAARALVTVDVVTRVVADAREHGAAIAAVPLADTLKRVSLGTIETTVPRQGLWCAQTPQAFRRDWIEAAHAATKAIATDDAALVEALGHPVRVTPGDPMNFKITTAEDLAFAEAWLVRKMERAEGSA